MEYGPGQIFVAFSEYLNFILKKKLKKNILIFSIFENNNNIPGPEIVVLEGGCVSDVFWLFENKDNLGDIWGCWPGEKKLN